MQGIDYHGALDELADACGMAQADMAFVLNPLQGVVLPGLPTGNLVARTLWKMGIFLRHIVLVGRLWMLSRNRIILVREFSNLPLLAVCIGLLPLRQKLVFTINHNLQWAVRSSREGFALRMLDQFGFRFMFFETKDVVGVTQLGLNSSRHWVVPHPVAQQECPRSENALPTVGIVGHYRSEKGIDEVLEILLASNPSFRLMVGIPNIGDFTKESRHGNNPVGFELRDTSLPETYRTTLAECTVVLLCYTAEGYRFRASGIIADAAACGTAVLAPRFPVLEHQIRFPVSIGGCYGKPSEITDCIDRIIDRKQDLQSAFAGYREGRGAPALAKLFDELVAGMDS